MIKKIAFVIIVSAIYILINVVFLALVTDNTEEMQMSTWYNKTQASQTLGDDFNA